MSQNTAVDTGLRAWLPRAGLLTSRCRPSDILATLTFPVSNQVSWYITLGCGHELHPRYAAPKVGPIMNHGAPSEWRYVLTRVPGAMGTIANGHKYS